ncbi:hypothetical protein ACGFH8_18605 [Micromonospora sp. NPDC049175]|uniref:hypothetical protein n=1 Tax=Micromonospora sp. NPDC049175 TaxID=3364266 RepID=UPI0037164741
MADETRIDPEGAHHLFKVVGSVADDIDDALTRVRNIRTSLNEPWGTDEYGRKFAQQQEPNAEQTLGYVATVRDGIRELAGEGHSAVDALVDQDKDNSANLS